MHYRDLDRQRAVELRETIEEAIAISKEHPKISFDRALELLEQRSPNPVSTRITESVKAPVGAGAAAKAPPGAPLELNVRLETEKPNSRRSVKFKRASDGSLIGAEIEDNGQ